MPPLCYVLYYEVKFKESNINFQFSPKPQNKKNSLALQNLNLLVNHIYTKEEDLCFAKNLANIIQIKCDNKAGIAGKIINFISRYFLKIVGKQTTLDKIHNLSQQIERKTVINLRLDKSKEKNEGLNKKKLITQRFDESKTISELQLKKERCESLFKEKGVTGRALGIRAIDFRSSQKESPIDWELRKILRNGPNKKNIVKVGATYRSVTPAGYSQAFQMKPGFMLKIEEDNVLASEKLKPKGTKFKKNNKMVEPKLLSKCIWKGSVFTGYGKHIIKVINDQPVYAASQQMLPYMDTRDNIEAEEHSIDCKQYDTFKDFAAGNHNKPIDNDESFSAEIILKSIKKDDILGLFYCDNKDLPNIKLLQKECFAKGIGFLPIFNYAYDTNKSNFIIKYDEKNSIS